MAETDAGTDARPVAHARARPPVSRTLLSRHPRGNPRHGISLSLPLLRVRVLSVLRGIPCQPLPTDRMRRRLTRAKRSLIRRSERGLGATAQQ